MPIYFRFFQIKTGLLLAIIKMRLRYEVSCDASFGVVI